MSKRNAIQPLITEKTILTLADSHLGTRAGDLETMATFIQSVDVDAEEILFLGDLFHIWAGPPKYHTDDVRSLLDVLLAFQQRGGRAHLVVGNRDIFLPVYTDRNPPLYHSTRFMGILSLFKPPVVAWSRVMGIR